MIVVVAALAMVGTLPGRTQGLGLITESLLADLSLSRDAYASMNFWATMLGALMCLPIGRALDQHGARMVLTLVAAGLGVTVILMSRLTTAGGLLVLLTLTRALGQSALSVVSISMVGKWFQRRVSLAMGVYSVLLGMLFAISFPVMGALVVQHGWRTPWQAIGLALLLGLAPLGWLLVRTDPESCGLERDPQPNTQPDAHPDAQPADHAPGITLAAAFRTPAFWAFALAASLFGLAASGIGLFNESIFLELGFDAETYHRVVGGTFLIGLMSQMISGWAGGRWSLRSLLVLAMLMYGAALAWLPHVSTQPMLWGNAVLIGGSGGIITVVFFAIWPQAYGRAHLGRIQGAAQMLTVFSSAIGPLIFSRSVSQTGSYAPALHALAVAVLIAAALAALIRLPTPGDTAAD